MELAKLPWWETGPIFSAQGRGERIVILPPGERVGRFDGLMLLRFVLAVICWTAVAVAVAPDWFSAGRSEQLQEQTRTPAWIALKIVAILLMLLTASWLHGAARRTYRRLDIAFLLAVAAAAIGIGAGLVIDAYRVVSSPAEWGPDVDVQLILLAVCAVALVGIGCWLPFAMHRTRRRATTISRLRAQGRRLPGTVLSMGRTGAHVGGFTLFRAVTISYRDGDAEKEITVAAMAFPNRVPLPGFPVVVLVDGEGVHVECAEDVPAGGFDPEVQKYESAP